MKTGKFTPEWRERAVRMVLAPRVTQIPPVKVTQIPPP
jgi:hypothetical protein